MSGEVHHRVYLVLRQQPGHQRIVPHVSDHQFTRRNRLPEAPAQVIQDDDALTGLAELADDMTADITGTAGDQYASV